ncbi:hypothetical protein [Corynebacterium sp.]|uniref:hypothetical protein n=1 Tax=Corynebacterium sp. TaxID=1720 RepID=UPI0026DD9420|nr:hypothetical protein [Corynebacterium sp.]MDO4610955.1 hypothetical protein [Corynebacterium sp.]
MHRGWLQLGQTELANTSRTVSYLLRGVRNMTLDVVHDDSWADLYRWLGREERWRSPWEDDDCPWFDPLEEASGEFAGVWVLSIDGGEATPLKRDVIDAATSGAAFGMTRTPARALEVEALVLAGTPRGLGFGLSWLSGVLRGDACVDGDAPRRLLFLDSAPPTRPGAGDEEVTAAGNAAARMLAEVAATSALEVTERFSPWVQDRSVIGVDERWAHWPQRLGEATGAKVQFTLTAGEPWVWSMPTPLVSGLDPSRGVQETVRFERVGEDGTCPSACAAPGQMLADPEAPRLAVMPRPVTPAAAQGCLPIASRRLLWHLEAGRLPSHRDAVPTVTIRAGARAERAVRVQWVQGRPETDREIACATVGEAMVSYLPAGATLTLDAVTGRATAVTAGGQRLDATPVVTGRAGGPWRPPVLRCGRPYTLLVDVDERVDPGLRVDVDAVVRRP